MSFAELQVRVTPRAGRNEVVGWRDDVLLVRLAAPPLDGKANDALLRFLAETLNVPPWDLALTRGHRSRLKRVVVDGLSPHEVFIRLGRPVA